MPLLRQVQVPLQWAPELVLLGHSSCHHRPTRGETRHYTKNIPSSFLQTFNTGLRLPAREAGFAVALEAGFAPASEAAALEAGFAAGSVAATLEAGFTAALDGGLVVGLEGGLAAA